MALKYHILPEQNLLVFTLDGTATIKDYFEAWDAILVDEKFTRNMDSLWDIRKGTLAGVTSEHLYSIKEAMRRNMDRRGDDYKIAFVVKEQVDYGVVRMFQAISKRMSIESKIFEDYDEAFGYVSALS